MMEGYGQIESTTIWLSESGAMGRICDAKIEMLGMGTG
eukprot:SAG31_NODE_574_length_13967_cov_7.512042_1_plen_38_part_00